MQQTISVDGRSNFLSPDPLAPDNLFLGDSLQGFYAFTERLILKHLHVGDRLLDIGCGDGRLALRLSQTAHLQKIIGVDIRDTAIQMARVLCAGSTIEFVHGDAHDISSLKSFGTVDVILARTSVHHFRDPIRTLKGYCTELMDRGTLILIDIDRESACYSLFGFPLTLLITWVTV
jgi:ubiquinone/menaquinone biosynthesis C-methylase UbiE